ncbi:MAG: MBG domain-containing protein, partial [Sphingomonadaceae bacterium]
NYTLSYTGANLTITPRALSVTADALSRIYGDANPALTYVSTGLVNGDMLTGALSTSATSASDVGAYGITQGTLAASSNYTLSYTGADLTITARPIAVVADNQTRMMGLANPPLTWVTTGLVNGDTLTGELATDADVHSGIGTYAITQGSLAASVNYDVTFVDGQLAVTPMPVAAASNVVPASLNGGGLNGGGASGAGAGNGGKAGILNPVNLNIDFGNKDDQGTGTGMAHSASGQNPENATDSSGDDKGTAGQTCDVDGNADGSQCDTTGQMQAP